MAALSLLSQIHSFLTPVREFRRSPEISMCRLTDSVSSFRNLAVVARNNRWRIRNRPLIDGSVYVDDIDDEQIEEEESQSRLPEKDYTGTVYVPVYVMLPMDVIDMNCELVDPANLLDDLKILKLANVDGVTIDCWWGIVEAETPSVYNWNGYKKLFQIVRQLDLKLQVVMSFRECEGNVGDDVHISLPRWVTEIGHMNPDIYFTDKEGRRNTECLSWGIDREPVLGGRTAIEVYFDFMRSFRTEFKEFLDDGTITEIEIGSGSSGELCYPSHPAKHGWKYPGIGEFQCYDKYLMRSLTKEAEDKGCTCTKAPDNAGSYCSSPHETGFFRDNGDYYKQFCGVFFLMWYSQVLIDHGDRVLAMASLAFKDSCISAKLSGITWWYDTDSHAAELTAGLYNTSRRDGYESIATMLSKYGASLNFRCFEMLTLNQNERFPETPSDPWGSLFWQVFMAAWHDDVPIASEIVLPRYDRDSYNKILGKVKPLRSLGRGRSSVFTHVRLSAALMEQAVLMEQHKFLEFERFVTRMHGEAARDFDLNSKTCQNKPKEVGGTPAA